MNSRANSGTTGPSFDPRLANTGTGSPQFSVGHKINNYGVPSDDGEYRVNSADKQSYREYTGTIALKGGNVKKFYYDQKISSTDSDNKQITGYAVAGRVILMYYNGDKSIIAIDPSVPFETKGTK